MPREISLFEASRKKETVKYKYKLDVDKKVLRKLTLDGLGLHKIWFCRGDGIWILTGVE